MKYEQFLELYNMGPETVYKLLLSIIETNKALVEKISFLEERIKELEAQLNKNSRNSSKPPRII